MDKQEYTKWTSLLKEMAQCIVDGNMDMAESYKTKADCIFESAKKEYDFFKNNLNNFGMVNAIIENKVTQLFRDNDKKPLISYIKMIKEDKNLRAEYTFYKAMENYTSSAPSKEYVKESLDDVKKMINEDTIKRSNEKLIDFMKQYHITKNIDMISEDKKSYYDSCQFLLEHKKKSTVLADMYDNIENVANFVEKNPRSVVKESKDNGQIMIDTINKFNQKYAMLEGEEKDMFNILLEKVDDTDNADQKSEKEKKKMQLLDSMKSDCLNKIDELEQDASDDDKEKIAEMRNLVNSMVYNESTIVGSIAKLIEVKEALSF